MISWWQFNLWSNESSDLLSKIYKKCNNEVHKFKNSSRKQNGCFDRLTQFQYPYSLLLHTMRERKNEKITIYSLIAAKEHVPGPVCQNLTQYDFVYSSQVCIGHGWWITFFTAEALWSYRPLSIKTKLDHYHCLTSFRFFIGNCWISFLFDEILAVEGIRWRLLLDFLWSLRFYYRHIHYFLMCFFCVLMLYGNLVVSELLCVILTGTISVFNNFTKKKIVRVFKALENF